MRPDGTAASEPGDDARMTIDELAAASDMTARNIRAHQSRGLLPPPRIEGRTGYYGPLHLRRLGQIRRLQEEGLNLAAIARLLRDGRLSAAAAEPFVEEEGELADPEALIERLRIDPDDPAIDRAITGRIISIEGDRVRVESPRLLAVAEQLADMGVPLAAQLDVVEAVQEASARVAEAFMGLADDHLVTRLAIETRADPDQVRTAVQELRVVASAALDAMFNRAMSDAIRRRFDVTDAG